MLQLARIVFRRGHDCGVVASISRSSALRVSYRCNADITEQHMHAVDQALTEQAHQIRDGLDRVGWAQVDNVLGSDMIQTMRAEAVELRRKGLFAVSQSTRFDSVSQKTIVYEKNGVEAMQLDGGDQYWIAPRMHEYVVQAARSLSSFINGAGTSNRSSNSRCAGSALDGSHAANKLAVCLGGGSSYDKHYDNAGGTDTRKLTAILYLNMMWRPDLGGKFRMWQQFEEGDTQEQEWCDIEPRGDPLLVFWADRCVHSVQASWAPQGDQDHRYALTVWLPTSRGAAGIERDAAMEAYHFAR